MDKTCGRGQKGQRSRSGGYHKVGFEGGQMPLQRRLPKVGFSSRLARITAEVILDELSNIDGDVIDIVSLRSANVVGRAICRVKIVATGKVDRPVTVRGLRVTKGARAAIEAAGGTVEV
jgi:large subunit ribosomal protein L15